MRVTDPKRRVYRVVVVPGWVADDGTVSREAFKPRQKDAGRLSASDKGCDAAAALATWNEKFSTPRQRVVSVSVQDCDDLGIPVMDDSGPDSLHVHLSFEKCADIDAYAEELAARATVEPDGLV